MNRTSTTLMPNDKGYAIGSTHPMIDLREGGNMGYGVDYSTLISGAVHVRKPVIPVLLRAPSGFRELPNSEYWNGTLRALLEEGFVSIDGLRTGREYEFSSTPVGGSGEIQEDVINATTPRTELTYNFRERYGMPINAFWTSYGDRLMMHPDTKYATISTLQNSPSDMLPDRYTFAMAFIEPDPTHRTVINAWVGDYMMPKNAGTVEGKRDMTAAGEVIDYAIPFTGIWQSNTVGVKKLAQLILDGLRVVGADPQLRPAAMSGITAAVANLATGYGDQIERFRSTAVSI
jgi:hypothetical protein